VQYAPAFAVDSTRPPSRPVSAALAASNHDLDVLTERLAMMNSAELMQNVARH
jgi:hypothetical protein